MTITLLKLMKTDKNPGALDRLLNWLNYYYGMRTEEFLLYFLNPRASFLSFEISSVFESNI